MLIPDDGRMNNYPYVIGNLLCLSESSAFRKLRSWHLVPSLHGKEMGKQWKLCQTLFFGAPKSLQMVTEAMKLKDTPWM